VSGQQHVPAALYPGEDPVPILQEAGWAPGQVWTGGKFRPHQDSIPDRPTLSQSLYRLSYRTHILNKYYLKIFTKTIYKKLTFLRKLLEAALKADRISWFSPLMTIESQNSTKFKIFLFT